LPSPLRLLASEIVGVAPTLSRRRRLAAGLRHKTLHAGPGTRLRLVVTPAIKRQAVSHLRSAFDMSERRACRTRNSRASGSVVEECVSFVRDDDAVSLAAAGQLRQRLRALAYERRRFGHRRLHVLPRREGFKVNYKRLFRRYREERLMLPYARVTLTRLSVRSVLSWLAFPSVPALRSNNSSADRSVLFAGFVAAMPGFALDSTRRLRGILAYPPTATQP
jgi:hypothetical protein